MPHWSDREREQNDWARQVPWTRPHLPYRDYGWEKGQSGLPEFRDPSVHVMPYERERVLRWRTERAAPYEDQRHHTHFNMQRRNAGERWEDYGRGRVRQEDYEQSLDWQQPGPYTGLGPKGYRRSDERIQEEVCQRLTQYGQIDASDMRLQVQNGEVTLDGAVHSRREKRIAEDIAESVAGVEDVHNNLRLSGARSQGAGRRDEVGRSGVYPASANRAPADAELRTMASWGQGERGAEGYYDSGRSELPLKGEDNFGKDNG